MNTHERHGLQDGDCVTFTEAAHPSLKDCAPAAVEVKSPHAFTLALPNLPENLEASDGVVWQVKVPEDMTFLSYAEHEIAPGELAEADAGKTGRAAHLHLAFAAVTGDR